MQLESRLCEFYQNPLFCVSLLGFPSADTSQISGMQVPKCTLKEFPHTHTHTAPGHINSHMS